MMGQGRAKPGKLSVVGIVRDASGKVKTDGFPNAIPEDIWYLLTDKERKELEKDGYYNASNGVGS
jgi:hypothetical protein